MATKSSETPRAEAKQAIEPAPGEGELRSPFIPLLWLLIPFIGCIAYGIVTSPRFIH
jgi:hypothetical protein